MQSDDGEGRWRHGTIEEIQANLYRIRMLGSNELIWRTSSQLFPIGLPTPTLHPRPFVSSSKASTSPLTTGTTRPPFGGVPVYPSSVMATAGGGGTPNSADRRRGRERQRFDGNPTLANNSNYGGAVSASYVPFIADAKEAWKAPGIVDPFATIYDALPQPRASSQPRQPPSSSSLSSTSSSSMPSKPYASRPASTSPSRGSNAYNSNGSPSGNKVAAASSTGGASITMNTTNGEVPLKAIKEALEASGYKRVVTFRTNLRGEPSIEFMRPAHDSWPSQTATLTFPSDFPHNRAQMKIDGKREIQPVYYRPTAPDRHVSPTEFVKAISLMV
jgi:hypothetical protein